MSLAGGWRNLRAGLMANYFEHQQGQMKDEAGLLLGVEMLVKARRQVGFGAPQFHLIGRHVGSPGLRGLCRLDWPPADAAEHRPVGGCTTSPLATPPTSRRDPGEGEPVA